MSKYYSSVRKSQTWIRKFQFYLIEIALYNSFVLYNKSKKESDYTFLTYKREITNILLNYKKQIWDEKQQNLPLSSSQTSLFKTNSTNFTPINSNINIFETTPQHQKIQQHLIENREQSLHCITSSQKNKTFECNNPVIKGMHLMKKCVKRRYCKRCYKVNNRRRNTFIMCETCDIYLCFDCFKLEHTEKFGDSMVLKK